MSLKLINGQWVASSDTNTPSQSSTVSPTIPQPQQQSQPLFSQSDPQTILKTLLGFIPGGQDIQNAYNPQSNPQQRLSAVQNLSQPFAEIGKFGGNLLKGMAGVPIRAGLSISDLFNGPNKLDVPLLGPQTSYQQTGRDLQTSGAGPVVSTGLPIVQALGDLLMGKGGISMVKGMIKPKVPQIDAIPKPNSYTSLPKDMIDQSGVVPPQSKSFAVPYSEPNMTNMLKSLLSPEGKSKVQSDLMAGAADQAGIKPPPAEVPINKPATDTILEKLVRTDKPPSNIQQKMTDMSKLNPYQFEAKKIENMGKTGQDLVTLGRRANNTAIVTAGELHNIIKTTAIDKLPIDQQLNLRDVIEGKAPASSPQIQQLADTWKQVFNKYGQETQSTMIDNYFPRKLNDAGKAFYNQPENQAPILDKITADTGMSRIDALNMMKRGLRKGSFENARVLDQVPPEFRANPIDEIYNWATDVSRRKGIIQNFGPKNEIANQLLSDIGKGSTKELQMKQQAQDYVNRIMGKDYSHSDLDPVYNFLRQGMVISKLNPLTTVANEMQGQINSFLDYGIKGLYNSTFGKGGNKLIDELGLRELNGKFGDTINPDSFASKWMKVIGMQSSEIRGFSRTAVATDRAITRAFDALKKDPTNIAAKQLLNDHAMYVDDQVLANDLRAGKISDFERKIGIVEGVRRKMFFSTPGEKPAWANGGAGGTAYTFHNYILNQMSLLSRATPARQLAYLMVIAPMTGLPSLVLRRMIQGKKMPKNPLDWYISAASSGPGTPFDISQSLSINPVSFAAGGFNPLIDLATSKNKAKSAASNLPGSSLYLNRLFPSKKQ